VMMKHKKKVYFSLLRKCHFVFVCSPQLSFPQGICLLLPHFLPSHIKIGAGYCVSCFLFVCFSLIFLAP
jgi:hypothetical protein